MPRRAAEVALGTVLVDGDVEAAHGRLGVDLSVGLERVDESVGGVVGLLQVLGLDGRGLFESLASLGDCSRARG